MKLLDPVLTVHLFPEERRCLLELLSGLDDADWARPTVCSGWLLKDIAAHLLADDLGRLSRGRDGFRAADFAPSSPERFEAELLEMINRQNELWVEAARGRFSPCVLIDLLRWSGEDTRRYFESLDMFAIGEPVSWAGREPAPVWLDIAREYTERWHHQAHIREAAVAPMLYDPHLFAPLIDTFIRALPHTFRETAESDRTHVAVVITMPGVGAQGLAPLRYSLVRVAGRWGLYQALDEQAAASVTIDGDVAWRLFTKGIPKAEAMSRSALEGDRRLAERVFDTVSVIA